MNFPQCQVIEITVRNSLPYNPIYTIYTGRSTDRQTDTHTHTFLALLEKYTQLRQLSSERGQRLKEATL